MVYTVEKIININVQNYKAFMHNETDVCKIWYIRIIEIKSIGRYIKKSKVLDSIYRALILPRYTYTRHLTSRSMHRNFIYTVYKFSYRTFFFVFFSLQCTCRTTAGRACLNGHRSWSFGHEHEKLCTRRSDSSRDRSTVRSQYIARKTS